MSPPLRTMAERARAASRALAKADRGPKDNALAAIAAALDEAAADERSRVRIANARDLEAASELGPSLIDRLRLDEPRLRQLARAVRDIAAQEDPVGRMTSMERRPNGLRVGQVQVPLGVVCMIFEARPNVTVDAAALCLKSGNACLLRGGKEARESNAALGMLVRDAIAKAGLPEDSVQVLTDVSRDETKELVALEGLIDLVIPRGGEGLVRFVKEHARVPVIEHYKGVCHLFVDEDADVPTALALVENGKLSRPGVCNATECVLVHELVAGAFLPRLGALAVERGLEVRGCPSTVALVPSAIPAQADDFGAEFLAPILACRVVKSFDEALLHVARYGSLHTEAICTRSYERAERFLREVDASCVLVNASTRFNDGGELGLGAEIGISTTKLHAYGPMGLDSLTTRKWIAYGSGQVR